MEEYICGEVVLTYTNSAGEIVETTDVPVVLDADSKHLLDTQLPFREFYAEIAPAEFERLFSRDGLTVKCGEIQWNPASYQPTTNQ